MKFNPLYPVPSTDEARKHILALVPIEKRNLISGLLECYRNGLIKEMTCSR